MGFVGFEICCINTTTTSLRRESDAIARALHKISIYMSLSTERRARKERDGRRLSPRRTTDSVNVSKMKNRLAGEPKRAELCRVNLFM